LQRHLPAGAELATVIERAIDELLKALRKRKYAQTEAPRPATANSGATEHSKRPAIPAHIRRAVYERDGGQCTFVSPEGHRCQSRRLLEFHHIDPVGKGGSTTVERLTLHCRAHNLLAARRDYGSELIEQRMAESRGQTRSAPVRSPSAPPTETTPARAVALQTTGAPDAPDVPDAVSQARAAPAPGELDCPAVTTASAHGAPSPSPMSALSGTSLASVQAPAPRRHSRRTEPQPECILLPGQLPLPMHSRSAGIEQNEAPAPAATRRPPGKDRAA